MHVPARRVPVRISRAGRVYLSELICFLEGHGRQGFCAVRQGIALRGSEWFGMVRNGRVCSTYSSQGLVRPGEDRLGRGWMVSDGRGKAWIG